MKDAKILDCTLRDGAYLIDKTFGDNVIRGIIKGLMKANIDIIEFGFLQTEDFGDGKVIYANGADASRFVPSDKEGKTFTVLADYSRYDVELLEDNPGNTFDAVRVCFFKHEREGAVDFCRRVVEKGYQVYVQPVDILGYTDRELIDLIEKVNPIQPYCFSIVDTFGSMYVDDLERTYHLINHNLSYECIIGFHSHNNLQMSAALSQEFLRMSNGGRKVIVDTTISGMGRGAGNTPTELVAQYMVKKLNYAYDLDAILDLIDTYMPSISARCEWGYSTPNFLAGCYSAHVNNTNYLINKNAILSKDIRYILNKIGEKARKRYDYDLLEETYTNYLSSDLQNDDFEKLKSDISKRNVVIIAPGQSSSTAKDLVEKIKAEKDAVVIAINHIPTNISVSHVFMSNSTRYEYWKNVKGFEQVGKIFTSNLVEGKNEQDFIVAYQRLIRCGWENMDNSTILLLRLLDQLDVKSIGIVGFDGYSSTTSGSNYLSRDMERSMDSSKAIKINKELCEMFENFLESRQNCDDIYFVTQSRFEEVLRGVK